MLVLRIAMLLALILIGGLVLAWFIGGNRKYLRLAWRVFQVILAAVLGFFALLVMERLALMV